jgi:hypothetical protein
MVQKSQGGFWASLTFFILLTNLKIRQPFLGRDTGFGRLFFRKPIRNLLVLNF